MMKQSGILFKGKRLISLSLVTTVVLLNANEISTLEKIK